MVSEPGFKDVYIRSYNLFAWTEIRVGRNLLTQLRKRNLLLCISSWFQVDMEGLERGYQRLVEVVLNAENTD